jgi:hypothetical protein
MKIKKILNILKNIAVSTKVDGKNSSKNLIF